MCFGGITNGSVLPGKVEFGMTLTPATDITRFALHFLIARPVLRRFPQILGGAENPPASFEAVFFRRGIFLDIRVLPVVSRMALCLVDKFGLHLATLEMASMEPPSEGGLLINMLVHDPPTPCPLEGRLPLLEEEVYDMLSFELFKLLVLVNPLLGCLFDVNVPAHDFWD